MRPSARVGAALAALGFAVLVVTGCGGDDGAAPVPTGDDALAGLTFTDVTAEAGLDEPHSDLDQYAESDMTSGAAVADVDGDGYLDIFLPRVGKPNALYMNNGDGTFTDVASEAGVAGPTDRFGSSAAAFVDVDGDGHLDLYVTGAGQGEHNLFINNGDGTFRDEATERGLVLPPLEEFRWDQHAYDVAVADVDGDGAMDLLVLHWYEEVYNDEAQAVVAEAFADAPAPGPQPCEAAAAVRDAGFPTVEGQPPVRSALFLNDGEGNFTDATEEYNLPFDEIVAFTGVFADLDGNGWQDLTITGDGCTSRVFRNVDGERFEDITDAAGVGTDENGMGSVVRDVDGDGHPDWFITSINYPGDDCPVSGVAVGCTGNRLYLNNGDATFRDATDEYGLRDGGWGWGAAIEDFSNDGRLEVSMTNGFRVEGLDEPDGVYGEAEQDFFGTFEQDATRFWVLDGDEYREAAEAVGIDDTTIGHALVAFDMDNDGDLDLLVVPSNEPPRLYRNDTPADRAWLSISLDDPTTPGNAWGDGARIEVVPEDGDDPIVGWISTGGSYESQRPPVFHVGLGDRDAPVARVDVHWPHSDEVQTLTDVDVRQQLAVERG